MFFMQSIAKARKEGVIFLICKILYAKYFRFKYIFHCQNFSLTQILRVYILFSGLYSSFLLTFYLKPSTIQYIISISFRWGSHYYFFHVFSGEKWALEHLINPAVCIWIFFFIFPHFSKVFWYLVPFRVSLKFWNNKYPHFISINVKLKVSRVFCILNSSVI